MMVLMVSKQEVHTLQHALRSRTVDLMQQIGHVQFWPDSKERKKEVVNELYDEIDRVEDLVERLNNYE